MSGKGISRKDFLQGAATGAAGIAAMGLLGSCVGTGAATTKASSKGSPEEKSENRDWLGPEPEVPESKIKETLETEVLVVGAGTGGLFAICAAVENGAKAMLIERNPFSIGVKDDLGAIGSKLQRAENVVIDKNEIAKDFVRYADGYTDHRLIRVWTDNSAEAIDWYIDRLQEKGIKVWLENSSGTPGGRDKAWVTGHSPVWTKEIKGGNMILQPYAESKGAIFRYSTAMVKLEKAGNRVIGAIAIDKDGNHIRIKARKGVIVSTGGYDANPQMMNALQPHTVPLYSASVMKFNLGDGIKASLWAGAAMDKVHTSMLFDRCAIKPTEVSGPQTKGKNFWMGSQPFLKVNLFGERFANESGLYDYITHASATQPGNCYCTIWDANYQQDVIRFDTLGCSRMMNFGNGAPPNNQLQVIVGMNEKLIEEGYIQKADTLEELAQKLNIPIKSFVATVERYNKMVQQGHDDDFGKVAYRLTAVAKAPFFGVRNTGMMLCTLDGIRINQDIQALDEKGEPISGLYVCGNDSGGYYAGSYPNLSTGNAAGRTVTFARRAGRIAATTGK